MVCRLLIFFSKSVCFLFFFSSSISRVPSSLDADHADVLSGLIWVQIVCKGNHQMTLASKEFMTTIQAN